jgi:dTDP-4-dehydrorhamnose reductase
MKILICGGMGQLGTDCMRVLGDKHAVKALDLEPPDDSPSMETLDITRPAEVAEKVGDFAPDLLLNCAAFTQVDACETERETAGRINGEAPGILAGTMEAIGGKIIHISTDYVFDGGKTPPESYIEKESPRPVSVYGKTKLEGEAAVQRAASRYAIVRTAWLYGARGHNFLKTILKLAVGDPERELRVVDDQFGSPTWSFRLAQQIEKLIDTESHGIYHATAEGHCTWYELATYFLKRMEIPNHIVPCASEAYPTPAKRPKNAILENGRLKSSGLHIMQEWWQDVDCFVAEFREQLLNETDGAPPSQPLKDSGAQ